MLAFCLFRPAELAFSPAFLRIRVATSLKITIWFTLSLTRSRFPSHRSTLISNFVVLSLFQSMISPSSLFFIHTAPNYAAAISSPPQVLAAMPGRLVDTPQPF